MSTGPASTARLPRSSPQTRTSSRAARAARVLCVLVPKCVASLDYPSTTSVVSFHVWRRASRMAFGVWPQSDAMTFLLSLLLVVSVLATSSAAPARPALAPVLYGPVPNYGAQPRGGLAVGRAELGGGLAGASLAGLGSRTLSQLAESELDRYAFLMLDPAASGSDSVLGTVTRRITPKSVFIAPSINGGRDQCDEGYHQDEMGRCIKVVKVDAQKSWDLLLDKLNSQFAELPAPLSVVPESTSPAASSSGAPPGAPPGPFQLTIPIADLPAAPEGERQPVSPSSELLTEAITEVVEEASTTVTPDEEEEETRASTVVPESMTALPAPAALVPEVVMLTSDEHLPAKLGSSPTAQVGAYLVNDAPARGTTAPVVPVNQSDNVDVNPIINTVNNSPLVTGETESGLSLVEEVPTKPSHLVEDPPSAQLQLLATALAAAFGLSATTTTPTSQLYDGNSSTSTTAPSLALTESTTGTPATWSSTTESVVSLSPESEPKVEDELPSTAATPESFTVRSTSIAPSFPTKPTTTSEPLEISSSSSSSDEALSSSDENRPSSSNSLRPALGTNAASTPVRFPDLTERPTVFRTQTGNVRFPTIDVTFPSPGDANRLQVDKRIVFPKEEKQSSVWWPPLASAPSFVTNWGLEQTRNRPLQPLQHSWNRSPAESYSFWSRSPSRLKHGPNKLGSSGGASPSSVFSSSSSSSSEESSQANRRTLSHSHSYRGSSSSHRRGRDWRPGAT